jgi:hypothetical protein
MLGRVAARLCLCSANNLTVNAMGGCDGGRRLGVFYFAHCCKSYSREQRHGEEGEEGGRGGGGGEGGRCWGGSSLENLHAIVECVSHDHAPVAVDGDAATRLVELRVA